MTSFVTLLAFKLCWLAVVFGALWGRPALGLTAVGLFFVHEIAVRGRRHVLLPVLIVAVLGYAIDNAYVLSGLLRFSADGAAPAPVWMALLWVNFALIVEDGLSWLSARPWLAAAVGAVSGPAAYFAGVRLGLIELTAPAPLVAAVLAATWGVALPLLVYRLGPRNAWSMSSIRS